MTKIRLNASCVALAALLFTAASCGGSDESETVADTTSDTAASDDPTGGDEPSFDSSDAADDADADDDAAAAEQRANDAGVILEIGTSRDMTVSVDDGRVFEFDPLECEYYEDPFEWTFTLTGTRDSAYGRYVYDDTDPAYATLTLSQDTTFIGLTELVATEIDGRTWTIDGVFSIIEDGVADSVGGTLTATCEP